MASDSYLHADRAAGLVDQACRALRAELIAIDDELGRHDELLERAARIRTALLTLEPIAASAVMVADQPPADPVPPAGEKRLICDEPGCDFTADRTAIGILSRHCRGEHGRATSVTERTPRRWQP